MRPLASSAFKAFRAFSLALAALAAVSSSPARAFSGGFDGGGRVGDYLDLVSSANSSGGGMDISGICASACTMKLGVRGACVHADTQFWFHAARNADGSVNNLGTLLMMQEYPRAIRSWALSHGALTSTQLTTMSGAQAIALGMPNCERASYGLNAHATAPAAYSPRPLRQASYCQAPATFWRASVACRPALASPERWVSASNETGPTYSSYAVSGPFLAHR